MPEHGARTLMNQKFYLHVLLFSASTNSESTGANATTPRGQESAFELTPWSHRSCCTPSSEPTPASRRHTDTVDAAGRRRRGRVGGQWRGEGAELYHWMMNVLAQPTPCCSCSLQSHGTSGDGSLDFAQVGGGRSPAASSHRWGESRRGDSHPLWVFADQLFGYS